MPPRPKMKASAGCATACTSSPIPIIYLVGRPSPVVRALVGILVSITLVLLPLATLLALQLEFLAYQSETVTWWQRLAIWLDVAPIAMLWPIILHPRDDWRGYWRELIAAYVPHRRLWLALAMLPLGLILLLFSAWTEAALVGLALIILMPLVLIPLRGWAAMPRMQSAPLAVLVAAALAAVGLGKYFDSKTLILIGPLLLIPLAAFWQPQAPRGALALLLTLYIGPLIPLALIVDGEALESAVLWAQASSGNKTVMAGNLLAEKRVLYLDGEVLLAKPPKPETLALIRSGKWQEALILVEPLNLSGRSLRHARMQRVTLIGTNLFEIQLQGADLRKASIYGATSAMDMSLVDIRGIGWRPLNADELNALKLQMEFIHDTKRRQRTLDRLVAAAGPDATKPAILFLTSNRKPVSLLPPWFFSPSVSCPAVSPGTHRAARFSRERMFRMRELPALNESNSFAPRPTLAAPQMRTSVELTVATSSSKSPWLFAADASWPLASLLFGACIQSSCCLAINSRIAAFFSTNLAMPNSGSPSGRKIGMRGRFSNAFDTM